MFKSRSPFLVPSIPGSSARKQVHMQEQKKRQMSVQPPSNAPIILHAPKLSQPSVFDERFCFQLSTPSQEDPGLYWAYDLTNQVINQSRRSLIFRQQQYYLKGRQQNEVYQTIYLTADLVTGYRDRNGISTNRICALHLVNIDVVIDASDVKTYDLLYKQIQDVAWQIPMDVTQLKFRIFRDDVQLTGNLSIPLVCQFDVRHNSN